MNLPDYNSPASLKEILDSKGFSMQKKFGQNFMINQGAREKIIQQLEIQEGEQVWEIGPGLGAISSEIIKSKGKLQVFEIDRGFIGLLKEIFADEIEKGGFSIVEGDVLKTWKKQAQDLDGKIIKIAGNLPYNIAATFIADTITNGVLFEKCVWTVQKEVAQRMVARQGSENYSGFSVLCQWKYDLKYLMELGSSSFWPRPNVNSAAVVMTKKENQLDCSNPKLFVKLVHGLFLSRRKTIQNNLKPLLPQGITTESFFEKTSISPKARAEELTLEQFIELEEVLNSFVEER